MNFSKNFSQFEEKPIRVEVYADADEVELLINGRSIERKKTGGEKRALTVFDTIYYAGCVEAAAYKDGLEIGRDRITTASGDVVLKAEVTCRGQALPADGSDIAYVDVSVEDRAGNRNPEAARQVSVRIEGPGEIIGFGSASPCNEENYYDTSALTCEGRIRAAVRATGSGKIHVSFQTEDQETSVEILSE